jgi:hypothetical protein
MEQMPLFADPVLDWPIRYSRDGRGFYVVTTRKVVPGVGNVTHSHRHLWEAVCAVHDDIAKALAVAPSTMF